MSLTRVLADGLVACVPFSILVWASFLSMPRLWLHSLPPDIQAMAPPKTAAERQMTGFMGVLVLLCFFGGTDCPDVAAALRAVWRSVVY